MNVIFAAAPSPGPADGPMEVVELKGLGHPDTICDALAEEACTALCRAYLDRFGVVMHHNVDKVLLIGGSSRPEYGGGEVLGPIEIHIAGRATREVRGAVVPVDDIVMEACESWLEGHLRLDLGRHVTLRCHLRPGSSELVDLFLRQAKTGVWRSNDTSIGVGFAPLTPLEHAVRNAGARLASPSVRRRHPEIGEDIKVLGIRRHSSVALTVAAAMVGRHLSGVEDYRAARQTVSDQVRSAVAPSGFEDVEITVNAADDLSRGVVYLTVTGTSAESGDDGEAGRGNRASGLITPYRPMTMESVAGKNPYSHVGKLYNVVAQQIAADVVARTGASSCHCVLVSRIGAPVGEPQAVELRIGSAPGTRPHHAVAEEIVLAHLSELAGVSALLARIGHPVVSLTETPWVPELV